MPFSRFLAVVIGLLAPIGETVRRQGTWTDSPPAIADDSIMGALLVWGAWYAGHDRRTDRAVLASASGFTCGFGYDSFFEQVRLNRLGEVGPSSIPSSWVVGIKGIGLALAALALVLTLRDGWSGDESDRNAE
jgi:hypothetical protein